MLRPESCCTETRMASTEAADSSNSLAEYKASKVTCAVHDHRGTNVKKKDFSA